MHAIQTVGENICLINRKSKRQGGMLMKTMMRFRIPTWAGLAFREIDDERQGWS